MSQTPVENGFFRWIRSLRINRAEHAWIGGVAAGVGRRFGIDPILARGILVVLCLFGGFGLAAYALAWALLPGPDGRIHAQEAARGRWSGGMTGALVFFLVGSIGRPWAFGFWDGDGDWGGWIVPALVVGVVLWLVLSRRPGLPAAQEHGAPNHGAQGYGAQGYGAHAPSVPGFSGPDGSPPFGPQPKPEHAAETTPLARGPLPFTGEGRTTDSPGPGYSFAAPGYDEPASAGYTPAPPEPRTPRPGPLPGHQGAILLGVAAVVAGLILGMENLGYTGLGGTTAAVALAAALLVIGIGIVGAAMSRHTGGVLVGFGVPVLILALLFGGASLGAKTTPTWFSSTGVTERSGNSYDVAFHNGVLDLGEYSTITEDTSVNVDNVFSNMEILVPSNIPVLVNSEGVFSSVRVHDGQGLDSFSGGNAQLNPGATGPVLTIDLDGVFNSVTITTQKAAATP